MIRKDPAQDTDRAHYYSQFWIEVAAGRPIGQSAQAIDGADEAEDTDFEALLSEPPVATPRQIPTRAEPKPKPVDKKEPARSLSSLADLASIADLMNQSAQMEDEVVPDIALDTSNDQAIGVTPEFDLAPITEETDLPEALAQEDDLADFEEEDEEEEDEWGNARKPKPKRPPRRDRRGF